MQFNKNLSKIQPSASMKVGLAEGSKPVTNLAIGVPDIAAPAEVTEILKMGICDAKLSYLPSKGTNKALANLKQLVFENETNTDPAKNLMLVSGAKYGIYLSLKTICNEGDTVLLMQPYWLSYPEIIHSLGLNFQSWIPSTDEKGNLDFDLNELEQILKKHSIKALVFNNPNNPSGKVFTKEWVWELNELLKKQKAWLLVDEVYKELVFDRSQLQQFSISGDNIIRVGSFSKSLCVPGLRVGYIAAPQQFIECADLFNQHIQTCVNSLSCYLIEQLEAPVFHSFAEKCAAVYKERFDAIYKIFNDGKLKTLNSEASFYSMVDFGYYFKDGQQAYDYLSSTLNINTVPGLPYGDHFKPHIRICLTLPVEELTRQFNLITNSLSR